MNKNDRASTTTTSRALQFLSLSEEAAGTARTPAPLGVKPRTRSSPARAPRRRRVRVPDVRAAVPDVPGAPAGGHRTSHLRRLTDDGDHHQATTAGRRRSPRCWSTRAPCVGWASPRARPLEATRGGGTAISLPLLLRRLILAMWAFHTPISCTSGPVRPPCSFSTLQRCGPFTDPSRARALPSVRLCLPVRHRRPAPATTSTTADRSSPPTRRRTRGRGRTTHRTTVEPEEGGGHTPTPTPSSGPRGSGGRRERVGVVQREGGERIWRRLPAPTTRREPLHRIWGRPPASTARRHAVLAGRRRGAVPLWAHRHGARSHPAQGRERRPGEGGND
jgi:hypothetical protein